MSRAVRFDEMKLVGDSGRVPEVRHTVWWKIQNVLQRYTHTLQIKRIRFLLLWGLVRPFVVACWDAFSTGQPWRMSNASQSNSFFQANTRVLYASRPIITKRDGRLFLCSGKDGAGQRRRNGIVYQSRAEEELILQVKLEVEDRRSENPFFFLRWWRFEFRFADDICKWQMHS